MLRSHFYFQKTFWRMVIIPIDRRGQTGNEMLLGEDSRLVHFQLFDIPRLFD